MTGKRARSVPRAGEAASRSAFDGVKLELGILLVIAVAAAILVAGMDAAPWLELLVTGAVGLAGGGWVAVRSHRVAREAGAGDPRGRERQGRADGPE